MFSCVFFFFSSRRRHTRWNCDWSSDVCSSDLAGPVQGVRDHASTGRVVWVKVSTDQNHAIELLKARPEVSAAEAEDGHVKITLVNHDTDHSIVADTLVRGGARLIELREDQLGLEEVFL